MKLPEEKAALEVAENNFKEVNTCTKVMNIMPNSYLMKTAIM